MTYGFHLGSIRRPPSGTSRVLSPIGRRAIRRPNRVVGLAGSIALLMSLTVAWTTAALISAPEAAAAQAICAPDAGFNQCAVFNNTTNADQTFTVPAGISSLSVKLWGAGGGGVDAGYYPNQSGGASGGYTTGALAVTPAQVLTLVVGQGGTYGNSVGGSTSSTYGGGGAGGNETGSTNVNGGNLTPDGSAGGGMSALFLAGGKTVANVRFVAGGGGGGSPGSDLPRVGATPAGSPPSTGEGGGASGGQDAEPVISGRGGSQVAGGAAATATTGCLNVAGAGTQFQGGAGSNVSSASGATPQTFEGGGGGGGGYFGGGGGKCQGTQSSAVVANQNGTGGGGSGFVGSAAQGVTAASTAAGNPGIWGNPGAGGAAPQTTQAQYAGRAGVGGGVVAGGNFAGGDGLIVLQWRTPTLTITKTSLGAVGPFTFTGTNGWTSQTITTTTAGAGVAGAKQVFTNAATATTVTETIPATWVLSSVSCAGLGSGGTYTPNLATGAVVFDIAAMAATSDITCTYTNTKLSPALTLAKSNPTSLAVGAPSLYSFVVTNSGDLGATTATVTDKLPANVAYTSASGATCTATGTVAAGQTLTCTTTGSVVASGGTATFTVTVTPAAGASGSTAVNLAAVDPTGGTTPVAATTCTGNGTPTAGCAVTPGLAVGNGVNLTLAKSNPAVLTVGTASAYSFVVTNSGVVAAANATVSDKLPANVGYSASPPPVGATCSATGTVAVGQTVTCTVTGPIAASGGTKAFSFSVTPVAGAAGTNVANLAAVDTTGGTTPVAPGTCTGNGTPTFGCAITPAIPVGAGINLSLAKTNPASLTAGVAANYSFVVTNNGTGDATNATVAEDLPANVAFNSAAGASCSVTSGTVASGQVIGCTIAGPITAGGGTKSFTINVTPTAAATGSVVNKAAVEPTGGSTPVDPSTCTATGNPAGCAVTPAMLITSGANLALAKTNPATLAVGVAANYSFTVTNSGTGDAATATVSDQLPANIAYNSASGATCSATGTVAAGQVVTCTITGPITAGGGMKNFTISVTPATAASGTTVANKAAVDPSGGTTPVNPTTCTNTGAPTVGCAVTPGVPVGNGVALTLAKTNPTALIVGVADLYSFVITNGGTGSAATATVTETLPIGIAYNSATGAACSAAGGTLATGLVITCTITGPIAGGGTKAFTINVTPQAASAGTTAVNHAAVDPSGGATPVDPSTCTATGAPTVGCAVTPGLTVGAGAALTLAKTNPAALTVGVPATYNFTITNGGTGSAATATVTETLPANIGFNSAGGATCLAAGGTLATGLIVTCTITGPIAASGGTKAFTINVTPAAGAAGTNVANYAAVDPTGGTTPPNPTTCTSSSVTVGTITSTVYSPAGCVFTPAIPVASGISLSLVKTNPAQLRVGVNANYTFVVSNTGTGSAANATVTDQLPANVAYVSSPNATCSVTSGAVGTGQLVTCTVPGPIAAGGTANFTIVVNAAAASAGTTVANKAAVDPTGGTNPPTPSGCSATGTPAGCAVPPSQNVVKVTAVNDASSTTPGVAVTTDVLANDTVSAGALNPASVTVSTAPGHGTTSVDPATGKITYTPAANFSGVDSYQYTVCDSSSPTPVCGTATVTVTVPNAVTAVNDNAVTPQNTPVITSVLSNDSHAPGGSPLNPASVAVTAAAAHGTTTVNPDGTITYTPAANFSGTDSYSYQVCDSSSPTPACSTATVNVTVPVNVVTANPDSASTTPTAPVTTTVLGNDTVTTNGAPLNPASVVVTSVPAHGTTTVNPDGTIKYTPAAGFSGTDTYTYKVCDTSTPTPVCSSAPVTVSVVNVVTANPDSVTTPQNTAITTTVTANDTISAGGSPLNPASVTVTSGPAHGTTSVDPATGKVTYTPVANYSGADSYQYQVCDSSSPTPVCSSTTVSITIPVNTVTAVADAATTNPTVAVTLNVLSNDTITAGGAPLNPASVVVTTAPAHGTTSVDPATGKVTYTPGAGFSGTDTFVYQVCDSSATPVCSSATDTITVPNAVTAVNDTATTPQNTQVVTTVLGNDTHLAGGSPLNPASVTVVTAPAHGTTSVDPATGNITHTPAANFSGTDSYSYRVCDSSSPTPACSTATVAITVPANTVKANPDVATTPPATLVTTNVLANDTITANGAPLNPASVAVTSGPAHGTTVVNPDGTIGYTPASGFSGTDSYVYQVCDSSTPTPLCSSATVTITVPNAVKANPDNAATAQNTAVTTNVLSNDTFTAGGSPLNPASVAVTTPPAHGTTTVNPDGTIKYTPSAGYTGPDSYTYQVCDSSTPTPACSSAVVTVTVGPNVVIANPDAATTPPITPVTVDVRANDSSSTGTPLANPTITTAPGHGTAVVNPSGTVTYTPAAGFSGVDTFVYQVCDTSVPTPVCASTTVTITVPNNVTAAPDASTTPQNTPVATDVLANDGHTTGGSPLNPASVTVTTAPAQGTTTVDPTTGKITYTPATGFSGTDSYVYQVCDASTPTPGCASATVTITVPANNVTANNDTATTTPGTPVTITVLGNDTVTSGGSPLNPASVTVTAGPAHGAVTIDPATGKATYVPNNNFSGIDTFTYQVCDSSTPTPVCSSATVTVTVPSTVTAVNDTTTTPQNTPTTTSVLGNDTVTNDGAPLNPASVTVTTAPAHGTTTVNPDGTIKYTPAANYSGPDSYVYRVCDTSSPTPVCSSATVSITVPANTVTATPDSATTVPALRSPFPSSAMTPSPRVGLRWIRPRSPSRRPDPVRRPTAPWRSTRTAP